jgi:hypothetical protein
MPPFLLVTPSILSSGLHVDIFRTRIGNGDVAIVFARTTHTPSLTATANVVEEQVEVVMSWPQLKMFEQMLHAIVDAIDQETGEIQIPRAFVPNLEAQRAAVQSLGFPSPTAKKT